MALSPKTSDTAEEWVSKYEATRVLHLQFTPKLEALVKDLLAAQRIDYHLLDSRTKEIASFREKLARSSKSYSDPINEITDFSGVRIIAYYQEDVDAICKLLESEFEIDIENSERNTVAPGEFGYKSVHYVIKIAAARKKLLEWKALGDLKAEIQVRTVLQHAWAAISHKLQYKREDDIPSTLKRKLFRLSALFELADDEFVALRNAGGVISKSIEIKLTSGDKNIEIDLLSIEEFIKQSPELAELEAIALEVGFAFEHYGIEGEGESVSKLITLAKQLGLVSIEEVESMIRSAMPWAKRYLAQQLAEMRKITRSSNWEVSPAFICQLILIGSFPDKVSVGHLLLSDWNRGIASRVLGIAKKMRRAKRG